MNGSPAAVTDSAGGSLPTHLCDIRRESKRFSDSLVEIAKSLPDR
jgi:hypothetical protein